jgi:acyl carrier protein phosphodiesterase
VNFFGHAILAARQNDDPSFVWGAMVPDFVALAGVRPEVVDPVVAAGVAHHHRVDAVFHDAEDFRRLLVEGGSALRAEGVPRGGARGGAHVGVELFLDGTLAGDRGRHAFHRALADAPRDGLRFADAAASDRWWHMHERLREHMRPEHYTDPAFVCERVIGALSRRARLALDAAGAATLRRVLPALRPRVAEVAPGLLALVGALI